GGGRRVEQVVAGQRGHGARGPVGRGDDQHLAGIGGAGPDGLGRGAGEQQGGEDHGVHRRVRYSARPGSGIPAKSVTGCTVVAPSGSRGFAGTRSAMRSARLVTSASSSRPSAPTRTKAP